MSTVKFNTWQNTDGTENYKCRAWVNFNGTGTPAIRESGNVSSITDDGTANYTVNFTSAMPDANYCAIGSMDSASAGNGGVMDINSLSTTAAAVRTVNAATAYVDADDCYVSVFR